MPRDLKRELDEFTGEFPVSWIPSPGEILVGKVTRYDTGTTEWGTYPIAVIRDEETGEERSVWLLHAVLLDEFKKHRPQVGERVGLKRLADAQTAKGQRYRRYAVRVDREEPGVPDLDGYSAPTDMPPPDPSPSTTSDDDEELPF